MDPAPSSGPAGRSHLQADLWSRRHRRITTLLWAHVGLLVAIALARGLPVPHLAVEVAAPSAFALAARGPWWSPRWRSVAAALGLMSAAAAFVHLFDGRTEAHFLYFVLLGVLALYDDWAPYAVAVGFVLLEHGVLGAIAPRTVFEDGDRADAWVGAVVHGGFVLAASVVAMVARRWRDADRAAVDEARALSEQRFQRTFEAAPIGVSLVGVDGSFLAVNQALADIVGYRQDELLALDFQAITHPDDLAADLDHVGRCLDGRSDGYTMEKRYLHRLGHEVWVRLDVAVVRDRAGRVEHFVSQIMDVGDRRAAAAASARFTALVEQSSDVISVTDEDGIVTYGSPAYATVLGFDPDSRRRRSLLDDVHPEDRVAVERARLALEPGARCTLRYRHAHAAGGWRWVETTMTNRTDDPAVGGYVGNTRDVTEQVEAIERLAHRAAHDDLTGLAGRALLHEELLARRGAAGRRGEWLTVLYIDLDHFKSVNDTLGHAAGDALLVQAARRLRSTARVEDAVARMGGDEFVLLCTAESPEAAEAVARRVHQAFRAPFSLGGEPHPVTASIGLATLAPSASGDVLAAADAALYQAKQQGRDRWVRSAAPDLLPAPADALT